MTGDWAVLTGGAEFSVFNYSPPGPVCEAYIASDDPISLIMGPVGSGKTTGSVFKCPVQTLRMPVCKDGVIRAKGCVVRDNYRTLYRTTLPSWFNFFPRDFPMSDFEGGQDRPAKHTLRFRTPRGQAVEMVVDFYAIGDQAIEELLKGYECSWGWLNEADLLHERVPGFLFSRTGRFPSRALLADDAAHMPRIVFGDLNPPDIDHWIYRDCVEEPKPGHRLFRQPSGLSDKAENRAGVPRTYYEELEKTMHPAEVRRFVHGDFGYSRDGRPVYDGSFSLDKHVSREPLAVLPGLPLHGGLDQGLSPALVVFQVPPGGQIRVLGELVPPHGTGPARFSELVIDFLMTRFRGLPLGTWSADPAGFYGADRAGGELSWVEAVSRAVGHLIMPAPSQEPALRREALAMPMRRDIDARTPGLIIDPSCRMLIGGLASHFKYRRVRQGSRDVFTDKPEKNDWSHPVEAAEYGVLGLRGRSAVIADAAKVRPGNVVQATFGGRGRTDFNVFDV